MSAARRKAPSATRITGAQRSRKAQAMDAGASIVAQDEAASLAICRDLVDGEEIQFGGRVKYMRYGTHHHFDTVERGQVKRRRQVVGPSRHDPAWAIHELRDMGKLSRDLVETAERFNAMILELEPRAKCAMFNDDVRGGAQFDAVHAYHLNRAHTSANVDRLFAAVGERVGAGNLSVFAMAFSSQRPSVREIRDASGRTFDDMAAIIERGLLKLWSLESQLTRPQQALTT